MLLADRVKLLNDRYDMVGRGKHHYSLYKRHLFADLLSLSHDHVRYYQTDWYCDAMQIHTSLPDKPQHSIVMWYAWRDTGTHMWIQNDCDPQMTGRYIQDAYLQYDEYVVKVFINPCLSSTWDEYVTFYYSVVKD